LGRSRGPTTSSAPKLRCSCGRRWRAPTLPTMCPRTKLVLGRRARVLSRRLTGLRRNLPAGPAEPPRFRIGCCIGGNRWEDAQLPVAPLGTSAVATLPLSPSRPGSSTLDWSEDGLLLQAQPRPAVSRAATSCRLALLGLRLAWPAATQACLARSSLTFDRRSSSKHLLGMFVVWPVRFPAYPTGGGEVCRHRSPACGR
jgi:hypothetical protein